MHSLIIDQSGISNKHAPEAAGCAMGDGETGDIWETGDTGDTGEKGDTRDTGLIGTTVLRLEIKPKNTVNSFEIFFKRF